MTKLLSGIYQQPLAQLLCRHRVRWWLPATARVKHLPLADPIPGHPGRPHYTLVEVAAMQGSRPLGPMISHAGHEAPGPTLQLYLPRGWPA